MNNYCLKISSGFSWLVEGKLKFISMHINTAEMKGIASRKNPATSLIHMESAHVRLQKPNTTTTPAAGMPIFFEPFLRNLLSDSHVFFSGLVS